MIKGSGKYLWKREQPLPVAGNWPAGANVGMDRPHLAVNESETDGPTANGTKPLDISHNRLSKMTWLISVNTLPISLYPERAAIAIECP